MSSSFPMFPPFSLFFSVERMSNIQTKTPVLVSDRIPNDWGLEQQPLIRGIF